MTNDFRGLCDIERRRLEEEEDRILATVLYNITAFMVMMAVNKNEIKLKVNSIANGRAHFLVTNIELLRFLKRT